MLLKNDLAKWNEIISDFDERTVQNVAIFVTMYVHTQGVCMLDLFLVRMLRRQIFQYLRDRSIFYLWN